LVIEAFPGSGGVPPEMLSAIRRAAARMPVVLTSRALFGRIIPATGTASGAWGLLKLGLINGGDLPAVKARILLMAALAQTSKRADLMRLFREATSDGIQGGSGAV
jgi:L-asparaginase